MRMLPAAVVVVSMACGCGGDDGDLAGATCGIDLTTSGGLPARIDHDVGVACATTFSFDEGVFGTFLPFDHPSGIEAVEVELPEVLRGMVGETTGDVVLRAETETWRVVGCGALVHEHRETGPAEMGTYYRVHATLTCATPAAPDTAGGPATTIDTLEMVYTVSWQ